MISAAAEPQPWSARKWWVVIGVVFAFQVGSIFWLREKNPSAVRPLRPAPEFTLAGPGNEELLALKDPTLFALPNEKGFSGIAWRRARRPELQTHDWSEPPRWLQPRSEQFGQGIAGLADTNISTGWQPPPMPDPALISPQGSSRRPDLWQSTLRIEGQGPVPVLTTPIPLPSWPPRQLTANDPELLTNTVVSVVVDAEGKPVSATLLSSSGSKAADDYALARVNAARFNPKPPEPIPGWPTLGGLRWCTLIFEWHTTLSPPASTQPAAP